MQTLSSSHQQPQTEQQQTEDTALIILLEACRLGRPLEQLALFRNCKNLDARRMALQWEARALGQTGFTETLKVQQRKTLLQKHISNILAAMPQLRELYHNMTGKGKGKGRAAVPGTRKVPAGLLNGGNAAHAGMGHAVVFVHPPAPAQLPVVGDLLLPGAAQDQAAAQQAALQQLAGIIRVGGEDPMDEEVAVDDEVAVVAAAGNNFVPPPGGFMALLMDD